MTVCLFYESVVFVDNLIVKVTLTEVACVCKFEQEQHHFNSINQTFNKKVIKLCITYALNCFNSSTIDASIQ